MAGTRVRPGANARGARAKAIAIGTSEGHDDDEEASARQVEDQHAQRAAEPGREGARRGGGSDEDAGQAAARGGARHRLPLEEGQAEGADGEGDEGEGDRGDLRAGRGRGRASGGGQGQRRGPRRTAVGRTRLTAPPRRARRASTWAGVKRAISPRSAETEAQGLRVSPSCTRRTRTATPMRRTRRRNASRASSHSSITATTVVSRSSRSKSGGPIVSKGGAGEGSRQARTSRTLSR